MCAALPQHLAALLAAENGHCCSSSNSTSTSKQPQSLLCDECHATTKVALLADQPLVLSSIITTSHNKGHEGRGRVKGQAQGQGQEQAQAQEQRQGRYRGRGRGRGKGQGQGQTRLLPGNM